MSIIVSKQPQQQRNHRHHKHKHNHHLRPHPETHAHVPKHAGHAENITDTCSELAEPKKKGRPSGAYGRTPRRKVSMLSVVEEATSPNADARRVSGSAAAQLAHLVA